jgi:hypothetical protein
MANSQPKNLVELLESLIRAERASSGAKVSVGELLDAVGQRSFGPLLLVPGLLVASPLSGIPGVPTMAAIFVLVIATQLLLGRECFWLPTWILKREISQSKVDKALRFLQRPARVVDKCSSERLVILTRGPAVYLIGAVCMLLAIAMPPLELIPFASSVIGAVLSSFGLALIARDGLLVTFGLACSIGGGVMAGLRLL